MSKAAAVKQALAAVATATVAESDYPAKGFHLEVSVGPEEVVAAAAALDQEGFFLEAVTGVDWLGEKEARAKAARLAAEKAAKAAAKAAEEAGEEPPPPPEPAEEIEMGEDEMEVVYDFSHYQELCRVVVRTRVVRSAPELPTISTVYPGADWHERETHDFFGIVFTGHPDLSPLLLPEDADFHPLRKDYQP